MYLYTDDLDEIYGSHSAVVCEAISRLKHDSDDGHRDPDKPFTVDEINDEIDYMISYDFDDFMYSVDQCKGRWFVRGTLELWSGNKPVWGVFDSLRAAIDTMLDGMIHFEVQEDELGNVFALAGHHDGENRFDIYRMTDEACMFYEDHVGEISNREMEKQLFLRCKAAKLSECMY